LRQGELPLFRAGKIHHAAYDTNIVGVDPDYRVHVRRDVLEEHDGPMLRHGLQGMQDVRIRFAAGGGPAVPQVRDVEPHASGSIGDLVA